MRNFFTLLLVFLLVSSAYAAGPDTVARSDRSLWPQALDSSVAFDRASRAEILVFSGLLNEISQQDNAALMAQMNIKQVDRDSVERVSNRLFDQLLTNFKTASTNCQAGEDFCTTVTDRQSLIEASHHLGEHIPNQYAAWYQNAQTFHRLYAGELIRLAALFPKVTSEIDSFSPIERNGTELADKHFLLTFDDGPTNQNGNTDSLLPLLDKAGIHATFYMLGERLQARLQQQNAQKIAALYQQQCAAMHGWEHQSHAKWEKWQTSVTDTRDLIQKNLPGAYRPWFRPPYGQRRSDSNVFFQQNHLGVALWNIDSQDWNNKVNGSSAGQRVLTLMLLWRHGVILFHDIHPKAQEAVPFILANTQQTGIHWEDCRTY